MGSLFLSSSSLNRLSSAFAARSVEGMSLGKSQMESVQEIKLKDIIHYIKIEAADPEFSCASIILLMLKIFIVIS